MNLENYLSIIDSIAEKWYKLQFECEIKTKVILLTLKLVPKNKKVQQYGEVIYYSSWEKRGEKTVLYDTNSAYLGGGVFKTMGLPMETLSKWAFRKSKDYIFEKFNKNLTETNLDSLNEQELSDNEKKTLVSLAKKKLKVPNSNIEVVFANELNYLVFRVDCSRFDINGPNYDPEYRKQLLDDNNKKKEEFSFFIHTDKLEKLVNDLSKYTPYKLKRWYDYFNYEYMEQILTHLKDALKKTTYDYLDLDFGARGESPRIVIEIFGVKNMDKFQVDDFKKEISSNLEINIDLSSYSFSYTSSTLKEQFTFPKFNQNDKNWLKQATDAGWPGIITKKQFEQLPRTSKGEIVNYELRDVNERLVEIFYEVQKKFGQKIPINFGARESDTNKKVGGVGDSAHLTGYAIDIGYPQIMRDNILKLIKLFSEYEDIKGLGVYKDGDVLHIDNSPKRAKRVVWSTSGYPKIPMWAKETVKKFFLKENFISESKLPPKISRRINYDEENIINLLKKFALRNSGLNKKIHIIVRLTCKDVAYELLDATQMGFGDKEFLFVEDVLTEYLEEKYGEQLKEFIENFFDESGDELGSKYVFEKHSERNGGNGFTEGYETWNQLLRAYSSWFPDLDWKELKMKLDNMSSGGKILIKKPGDRNNIYNYYFSLQRFDVPNTRKREQNEQEITERCWKGYTQKGMKTMFGKRYPNCVKKTK